MFNESFTGSEKNKKRDVSRDYFRGQDRNDYNAPPGRGDIPIIHGDCDGKEIKILMDCIYRWIIFTLNRELIKRNKRLNSIDQEASTRHC